MNIMAGTGRTGLGSISAKRHLPGFTTVITNKGSFRNNYHISSFGVYLKCLAKNQRLCNLAVCLLNYSAKSRPLDFHLGSCLFLMQAEQVREAQCLQLIQLQKNDIA